MFQSNLKKDLVRNIQSHVTLSCNELRRLKTLSFATRPLALTMFVAILTTSSFAKSPDVNRPNVRSASDEAQQAIETFKISPDWRCELVAAEPLLANVVAMDVDHEGNIYVAETFRQGKGVTDNRKHDEQWLQADLASKTVQERIDYFRRLLGDELDSYSKNEDRIRKLIDTDGDGIYDKSTIFADGFHHLEEGTGAGVLSVGDDVIYTCIPKLWKLTDLDRDGVAETRTVLSDGYGVRVALRGHDSHGPIIGPDGRLYFSIGDRGFHIITEDGRTLSNPDSGAVFRCELDGSDLTVFANGLRNPQELAFNDVGDLFTVDNNSDSRDEARIVHILRGGDSGWRMHYQYLPDRGIFNRERIWEPLNKDQSVSIVPPIANFTDGPCGLAYYPGSGFGDQLKDQFLICDFRATPVKSGIRSFKLDRDGASYKKVEDAKPVWQILATDVAFDLNGDMLVADWVDGWMGKGQGRIYKIRPNERDEALSDSVHQILTAKASEISTDDLARYLSSPDQRVRMKAQFELVRRADSMTLTAAATAIKRDQLSRLHAIWGLGQLARADKSIRREILSTLEKIFSDEDPEIVRAAIMTAGESKGKRISNSIAVASHLENARVQAAVWTALANVKSDVAINDVAARLAASKNEDAGLRQAAIYYWSKAATPEQMIQIANENGVFVRRCIVAALRRSDLGSITPFLSDDDPSVVAEAVRAVHDDGSTILTGDILKLALSSTVGEQTDETLRRVVNTADRIRSAESAAAMVAMAQNDSLATSIRLAAIENLGEWTKPRTIDKYDHTYLPREKLDSDILENAIKPALPSLTSVAGQVKRATIKAASAIGVVAIAPELGRLVQNTEADTKDRAVALRGLGRLDPPTARRLAKNFATDPIPTIALAALAVLDSDVNANFESFVAATSSADLKVRQTGWDGIAKVKGSTVNEPVIGEPLIRETLIRETLIRETLIRETLIRETLIKATEQYLRGELEPSIELNVIEAIQATKATKATKDLLPFELRNQFDAKIAELDLKTDARKYESSLAGGSIKAGEKIFLENTKLSCLRCHRVDGSGGAVGPSLTVIGATKTPEYLLESICFPDSEIAKGFETTIVATDSGEIFSGIVIADDDDNLTLRMNDNSKKVIDQMEIVVRKPGQSSMPNDLINYMNRRELRDLVAYLGSLKVEPSTAKKGKEME